MSALLATKNEIKGLLRNGDLLFVMALFGTVMLLVIPIPPAALDLFLAASIGISLLILLIIIYVKDPSEFSGFPTLLLSITLFRLALNVATTRLILGDGHAGKIIDTFGNFVVRGNYVVGAVVFLILIVINFMVITKGAGRIAEVAARFTLDAMPGKQMSIDAELNAGLIDETTARMRREKIQKESEFYGAMDGASKFVRGDAIAGILITLINVLGGFAIGIAQKGMLVQDALQKYTLLSIGDGLVAQVPALIVSIAAGILVTRVSGNSNLGEHISGQLTTYPRALGVASILMGAFCLVPGMPIFPFLLLSLILGGIAYTVSKAQADLLTSGPAALVAPNGQVMAHGEGGGRADPAAATGPEDFRKLTDVSVFSVELGFGLLHLAEKRNGGDLLDRITGVRKAFARDMGMVVPPVSIRDNPELDANEYRFLLRGKQVDRGTIYPQCWLAMNVTNSPIALRGTPTIDPVFGISAIWIDEDERRNAEISGFTVVDPASVMITHLTESVKRVAHLILSRQDVQGLIDHLKESNATLVTELIPDLANIGLIQRVLQNLLREGISIKNLPVIMESVADFASLTKNPDELSEQARRRLGIYFVSEYESEPGVIKAITLEPRLEQGLAAKVQRSQFDVRLMIDPHTAQYLLGELTRRANDMAEQGLNPILIVSTELRLALRQFFEPSLGKLIVLAYQELPVQTEIQSIGVIQLPQAAGRPVAA